MNKEELLEAHAMIMGMAVCGAGNSMSQKVQEYYNEVKELIKKYALVEGEK